MVVLQDLHLRGAGMTRVVMQDEVFHAVLRIVMVLRVCVMMCEVVSFFI